MLLQLVIIVDAPVVVLVPARRQRETSSEIDDGRLVGLAVKLNATVTAARCPSLEVEGGQEGRLSRGGINFGELGLGGAALFGAADPNVVRDTDTKEVVTSINVEDCPKLVFEVVL